MPDININAKQKLVLINAIQYRDILLAQCPEISSPSDDIKRYVLAIKDTLKRCQQLNDANGSALQRAQLSMRKLRNLFEETGGKNELTYDSEGQAFGRRTLGTNIKA
ncbi:Flagellar biosynthesis protein FlgN [Candidatus Enterovibrio escicola]|uniref:Flagellar biosynthesis protein FlgN n=1 Tax=Candidatus Enterovibrio escicola TaxID=1927127 RepID=A0A2A5T1F8_9GAMM|nr:Flagellar biosynthesis protein FlgN [Candidatus Enterovibrio escacola]